MKENYPYDFSIFGIQWNPSYPGSVGPRGASIFETARKFESS